jgi:hypothetical protein
VAAALTPSRGPPLRLAAWVAPLPDAAFTSRARLRGQRDRKFVDSLLEEAGFELSVPPERKAVSSAIANPPASLAAVGFPYKESPGTSPPGLRSVRAKSSAIRAVASLTRLSPSSTIRIRR